MAWQTPKTNWTAADGVRDSDFNRIEGNILALYEGAGVTVDTTVYVSLSGDDTAGDGTYASPYRTIQRAINSLPKNLGGRAVAVDIDGGNYGEEIVISGFSGVLKLISTGLTVVKKLTVEGSTVVHSGSQMNFLPVTGVGITVQNSGTFVSAGPLYVGNGTTGAAVTYGGRLVVTGTLTVSNTTQNGIDVYWGGRAYIGTLAGNSNTGVGMAATNGGIIQYATLSLATSGTRQLTNGGGRIYSGAQSSIPNY